MASGRDFDNRKVILVWHFDKISESIVKLIISKLQRPGYLKTRKVRLWHFTVLNSNRSDIVS